MIGGVKTKIKIIDYALLFALLACLCLMMSMTGISAADSDNIFDNQSAINQIPLEDNQDELCGFVSVNHEMHTSYSFDQSDDSSDLHFNKADETPNLKFGQSGDSSNLDFEKSHDEINTTLNQSLNNNLHINKVENHINGSNLADSRLHLTNQTTLHDCGYDYCNTNLSDANFDDGKTVEYEFSGDFIDSYNLYTINQINFSNYAQIPNIYFICITRYGDESEKFYSKDSNMTLNFNHIFEGMSPDGDNAPNHQFSDDSIHERGLSFDELIIEDGNCIPSDYQFLDQLIKLDYENNISAIYKLGNTHTGYNSTYTDINYETLLSPIILSFNLKSGFTFNYRDSWYPNVNIININKNCVKISGVYAEGNRLTIINNSLKCIYAAPKFISKESGIVVENPCKYLIFNNTLTLNNNMQDYQTKCLKTITPTGILILNNYCNNIKKCIFESSHLESTSVISNSFSVSNFVFNKTITSMEIMEILSIFTHAKSCNGQRDGTLAIIDLEQINCNDYSIMSNGGK